MGRSSSTHVVAGARDHRRAVATALFVTFLWSTSWVLIKIGLETIPPLPFAGLRYGLATMLLLPFAWRAGLFRRLARLDGPTRRELLALGLVLYALTQGAQFAALALLPAATVSVVLAFTPVVVAGLATATLRESLRAAQWAGITLASVGALVYFGTGAVTGAAPAGLLVAVLGLLANAVAAVLGRSVARRGTATPLDVTVASMGIGAITLVVAGVAWHGPPALDAAGWVIVGWLAVVNTALAFVLWNRALRRLGAAEASVLNTTMVAQIPVLAAVVLNEPVSVSGWLGIALVAAGAGLVQRR